MQFLQNQLNIAKGTLNAKMELIKTATTYPDIASEYFSTNQCIAIGIPPTFQEGKINCIQASVFLNRINICSECYNFDS